MIGGFIFIVLFVFIFFAGIVVFIIGRVKKNKALWISGGVLFLVASITLAFTIFNVVRDGLEKTKDVMADVDYGDVANKTGEDVGKVLGDGFSGVTEGFDKSLDKMRVKPSAGLSDLMELGRSDNRNKGGEKYIDVFITFKQSTKGFLKLTVLDGEDLKSGVAFIKIDEKAGAEKMISFHFDERTKITSETKAELSFQTESPDSNLVY